ncbi:MAG: thiamine-phosphate kinase [Deltaproteobacteria bacterium]|nr:thiamine-phosphate kinase [Deltaproteobacteria bacterium]
MRDVGEVALLEEISRLVPARAGVIVGPGDDAAVVARSSHPLLLTTDALVEGVHFRRPWLSGWELGRRGFHVAASDVAAMGGRVRAVLLAIAAPPTWPAAELRGVVRGVRAAAARAGGALAGGNLATARELSLTVTVLGDAPARPVLRSGARIGDDVWVTGSLGGAAFGLRLLLRARRLPAGETARRWWRRPVARLRAGEALAAAGIPTAMMDLSDGLAIDAGRLVRGSGRRVVIEAERLPLARCLAGLAPAAARRLALVGGEDYELLFTAAPRQRAALARLHAGVAFTRIGTVAAGRGLVVLDGAGRPLALPRGAGHEHFRP